MGYMGYGLSRMASQRAEHSNPVEPLPSGTDPLAALDPETRALVTSLEPAADSAAVDETTFGDRLGAGLLGAGMGAFAGAMIANWTPRHQRWSGAPALNASATLTFAGIGAAIGGVAGFAKGRDPLQRDPKAAVEQHLPQQDTTLGTAPIPTHPAFASLSAR